MIEIKGGGGGGRWKTDGRREPTQTGMACVWYSQKWVLVGRHMHRFLHQSSAIVYRCVWVPQPGESGMLDYPD